MRKNEYSQDNCVVLAVTYRFDSSENGNEIGGIIIPLTPLNVKWCRREDSNFHWETPTRP